MDTRDLDLQILSAFPQALRDDVVRVVSVLPTAFHSCSTTFRTTIGDEALIIPYRVYYDRKAISFSNLTSLQQVVLGCVLTRHHDGFVRRESLGRIISHKESWIPPFVIQLVGEYVVEILEAIHNNLSSLDSTVYAAFLTDNISFWETTKQRVVSYWDCYYRRTWKHREDYVGFRIIEHLDSLLLRTSGV
jgi:hypothetical protein